MRFEESTLAGACLVTSEPACDERGFFTRTFCVREFAERGLETIFVQHSTSYNIKRGTLRGMHFQRPPHDEVKLVSCLKGAIQDVIIDLRPGSATFGCWEAFELTERNRCRLYIPKGFAHGFQTLADDTEVGYLISQFHVPNAAAGYRYDDPVFAIDWPLHPNVLSDKDRSWPVFATSCAASWEQKVEPCDIVR
jgi:dTDP-4-dehydrorhamnose 3,5-epimerase